MIGSITVGTLLAWGTLLLQSEDPVLVLKDNYHPTFCQLESEQLPHIEWVDSSEVIDTSPIYILYFDSNEILGGINQIYLDPDTISFKWIVIDTVTAYNDLNDIPNLHRDREWVRYLSQTEQWFWKPIWINNFLQKK